MIFNSKRDTELRDKIIAYKKVFGSAEGKTVLFDLMNRYHVLNKHDGDPFAEGQRSVVLDILHQRGVNLEELDKMLGGNE